MLLSFVICHINFFMFRLLMPSFEIVPSDWIHHLKIGDPVWLVKEKMFAVINRPYMQKKRISSLTRENGDIGLARSIELSIDLWIIHRNGTGIDGSLLMVPAPGWTFTEQPQIEPEQSPAKELTEKEKELCDTIDILEKEIKKLNETKSYSDSEIIFTEQLKKHGFITDVKQNTNTSHKAVMAADATIPPDVEVIIAKLRDSKDHCPGCYHHKEFHDDIGCRNCGCNFNFGNF